MKQNKLLFSILCSVVVSGCGIINQDHPGQLAYAPVEPTKEIIPPINHGGIYHKDSALSLFETIRARHVGDILTVELVENADAKKKTETTGSKNSDVTLQNPTLFGRPFSFGHGANLEMDLHGEREFNGRGESKQDHQLKGNITVSVYEVLPNGNLKIRGEKWIRINEGDEYIRLTGIVRPADITGDNTISSLRIADARIIFTGKGQIADNNRSGWLQRIFTHPIWGY